MEKATLQTPQTGGRQSVTKSESPEEVNISEDDGHLAGLLLVQPGRRDALRRRLGWLVGVGAQLYTSCVHNLSAGDKHFHHVHLPEGGIGSGRGKI